MHATRCGKVLLGFRAAQRQRSFERFVRENIVLILPSLRLSLRGWGALANKEFGDLNRRLGIFGGTKLGWKKTRLREGEPIDRDCYGNASAPPARESTSVPRACMALHCSKSIATRNDVQSLYYVLCARWFFPTHTFFIMGGARCVAEVQSTARETE